MFRPSSLVTGPQRAPRAMAKLAVASLLFVFFAAALHAGDLRIPLPKRSKYTPVQALNRDGVKAVEKHDYERAKKLFYKAYLIDPNDPFTLNNLGYMAELDGNADRARRFYALSAELGSDAIIDKTNDEAMKGKPVSSVAGRAEDKGIKINRLNNEAIALLEKDRAPEADLILQKALTLDPQNPFTLNNLGYAKEKEGEVDAAYQFYSAAADRDSQAKVEVALDKDWRGRAISDVAHDNARKLNRRLRNHGDTEAQVALLNLRGVSALNRNDRRAGREFIQKAFKLDPSDAFTLNNMGYLAEMDGDRETADFYYERAREANESNARVVVATRKDAEGRKIGDVADNSDQLVESRIEMAREERQRQGGPVILMRRDNSAVLEPPKPVYTPPRQIVSDANGDLLLPVPKGARASAASSAAIASPASSQPATSTGGLVMPLPDNEQPTTVKEGDRNGGLIMPLPEDEQPNGRPSQPSAQPQPNEGQHNGGLIMPLPDDKQPNAVQPSVQPSQPSAQPQPNEGQHNGGLIMPLPDDKQPNAVQPNAVQPNAAQPDAVQPTVQPAQPSQPAAQPQPNQGHDNGGLLMPLPDDQQPGAKQPPLPQAQSQESPAPKSNSQPVFPSAAQPSSNQPVTLPAQPQAQPQAPVAQPPARQNPPLLLPPPDKQSNSGTYTPPPASSNPGGFANAPAPVQHISDMDQAKPQQKKPQQQQKGSAPKKISDED